VIRTETAAGKILNEREMAKDDDTTVSTRDGLASDRQRVQPDPSVDDQELATATSARVDDWMQRAGSKGIHIQQLQ